MSDFSRFRSAFNGFSRTDVVNYIEETSAAHQKAIEQLEGEKQQLMQENDHLLAENARLTTELAAGEAEGRRQRTFSADCDALTGGV